MFDPHKRDFHLARAGKERAAADNATLKAARALHLQLAEMHAVYARLFGAKRSEVTAPVALRREGAPVRVEPDRHLVVLTQSA